MSVYIDYQTEWFHGIVGPFASRERADEWAEKQAQDATWEGARKHYTPDRAAAISEFNRITGRLNTDLPADRAPERGQA